MWNRILPSIALLCCLGCEESDDTVVACGIDCGSTPDHLSDCRSADGDPLEIADDAALDGELLSVTVSHSGGCAEHHYVLCLPAGGFSEGIPVGAHLEIWHDANDDMCEALETETLTFDIAPLVDDYIDGYGEEGTLRISIGSNQLDYAL